MSTLKVNTIQNTSAAHSSTPEQIVKGRAKAWVNFDGVDVTTNMTGVDASFNVAAVTDNALGEYTITFSGSTFTDTHYCFTGSVNNTKSDGTELAGDTRGPVGLFESNSGTKSTTSFKLETRYGSTASNAGGNWDFRNVYCIFFGD